MKKPWYMRKTTWTGIAIIVTTALPQFGVPAKVVGGIYAVIGGLAVIFLREAIETNQTNKPGE